LDSADTSSFDGGDLDISHITPASGPGVSDDVVLLSTLGSVTDSSNSVIKVGSALGGVHDTAVILLEDHLVSLNSDRDDTIIDGGLELRNAVWWNGFVAHNLNLFKGCVILASLVGLGGTWYIDVSWLELLSIFLDVLEGFSLPSALAAIVSSWAGNNLLLGKAEEGVGSFPVSELNSAGGTEGPAWTTLSLVLDGVDSTGSSPVDGLGEVGVIKNLWLLDLGALWHLVTKSSLSLFISQGREHVVGKSERRLLEVGLLDVGILIGEDLESVVEFLFGTDSKSELLNMVDEFLLDELHLLLFHFAVSGWEAQEGSGGA
jgi:hypothetical protein